MATIRISKMDAARRQIDAAIRMLFDNVDPFAVHTLAAAGYHILRDIADAKDTPAMQETKAMIRPGMEGKFWGALNTAANFLKHADRDADEICEIDEQVNDFVLIMALNFYTDLGHQLTPEMLAMWTLFGALHPDLIKQETSPDFHRVMQGQEWLRRMTRQQQLAFGKQLIAMAKAA